MKFKTYFALALCVALSGCEYVWSYKQVKLAQDVCVANHGEMVYKRNQLGQVINAKCMIDGNQYDFYYSRYTGDIPQI